MAKRKAKGLGDTIEQITEVTGIKKLVEFVAGEDCGCEERKKKLNELFPYRNTNCLTEEEYTWLNELRPNGGSSMKDQLTRLEQRVDDLFLIMNKRQ